MELVLDIIFKTYFYIKYKGKGKFAPNFIPSPKNDDNDYLKQIENSSEKKN